MHFRIVGRTPDATKELARAAKSGCRRLQSVVSHMPAEMFSYKNCTDSEIRGNVFTPATDTTGASWNVDWGSGYKVSRSLVTFLAGSETIPLVRNVVCPSSL